MNLLSSFVSFQPALLLQTLKDHVHQADSSRLLDRQQHEGTHEGSRTHTAAERGPETPSPRWGLCCLSMTKTLFRSFHLFWPPHAAHHQLHCFFSLLAAVAMLRWNPPNVIFTRCAVAMTAHARQCDPFLQVNWHDDPPQEVGALLHNLLHDALAWIVILLRLVVASRQLRFCPGAELVPLQQLTTTSARPALIAFLTILPGTSRSWLSRAKAGSSLCGDSLIHVLPRLNATAASSNKFFAWLFIRDLFPATRFFRCLQLIAASFLSPCLTLFQFLQRSSVCAARHRLPQRYTRLLVVVRQIANTFAEVFRGRLAVVFHHH